MRPAHFWTCGGSPADFRQDQKIINVFLWAAALTFIGCKPWEKHRLNTTSELVHFQLVLIRQWPGDSNQFCCGFHGHVVLLPLVVCWMCALTAAGIKEDVWCLFLHVVFPLQPQPPGTQRHLTVIRTRGKGMKTNTVVWSSGFLAFVKRFV